MAERNAFYFFDARFGKLVDIHDLIGGREIVTDRRQSVARRYFYDGDLIVAVFQFFFLEEKFFTARVRSKKIASAIHACFVNA